MNKTKLQIRLMAYVNEIRDYGVPDILISRFERIAIRRYEEMKKEIIICECGFTTRIMKEMINHIEEYGNHCNKFVKNAKEEKSK